MSRKQALNTKVNSIQPFLQVWWFVFHTAIILFLFYICTNSQFPLAVYSYLHPLTFSQKYLVVFSCSPRGVLPNSKEVGGPWTSHQAWRQNLGQGPAKFKEKFGKFCHHKMQKLGESSNFGVIYMKFRGQNLGYLSHIFGGKIGGQAPQSPNMEVPPGLFP